jgi:hypothetical protein
MISIILNAMAFIGATVLWYLTLYKLIDAIHAHFDGTK